MGTENKGTSNLAQYIVKADEMAGFFFHCGYLQSGDGLLHRNSDTCYLQYGSAGAKCTLVFQFEEYVKYIAEYYQMLELPSNSNMLLGGVTPPIVARLHYQAYLEDKISDLQRDFLGDLGLHIALQACNAQSFQYRWEGLHNVVEVPDVSAHLRSLQNNEDWSTMTTRLGNLAACYRLPYSTSLTDGGLHALLATALYGSYASANKAIAYPLWNWCA